MLFRRSSLQSNAYSLAGDRVMIRVYALWKLALARGPASFLIILSSTDYTVCARAEHQVRGGVQVSRESAGAQAK